jgi:hypothetical protein
MGFDELSEPAVALEAATAAGDRAAIAAALAELHRLEHRILRGATVSQPTLAEAAT